MITLLQPHIPHAYFPMLSQICNQATHLGKPQGPAEGSHRAFQVLWQVEVLEERKYTLSMDHFLLPWVKDPQH